MSFAPSRQVKDKYYYIGRQGGDEWQVFEQGSGSKGKFSSKKKAKDYLDSL